MSEKTLWERIIEEGQKEELGSVERWLRAVYIAGDGDTKIAQLKAQISNQCTEIESLRAGYTCTSCYGNHNSQLKYELDEARTSYSKASRERAAARDEVAQLKAQLAAKPAMPSEPSENQLTALALAMSATGRLPTADEIFRARKAWSWFVWYSPRYSSAPALPTEAELVNAIGNSDMGKLLHEDVLRVAGAVRAFLKSKGYQAERPTATQPCDCKLNCPCVLHQANFPAPAPLPPPSQRRYLTPEVKRWSCGESTWNDLDSAVQSDIAAAVKEVTEVLHISMDQLKSELLSISEARTIDDALAVLHDRSALVFDQQARINRQNMDLDLQSRRIAELQLSLNRAMGCSTEPALPTEEDADPPPAQRPFAPSAETTSGGSFSGEKWRCVVATASHILDRCLVNDLQGEFLAALANWVEHVDDLSKKAAGKGGGE